jgi:hypothetical protein
MATTGASPAVHASTLDHGRRLQECLHALNRPGWEGRMQPLAVHMAEKRLVRARSDAGGRGAHGGCAAGGHWAGGAELSCPRRPRRQRVLRVTQLRRLTGGDR